MIFFAFVTISTIVIIAPIFFYDGMKDISDHGIFGETLRTSINLKIAESICIGSTLPMLVDVFLDEISKVKEITGRMNISENRTLFILAFSMSSAIYLCLGNYDFMPFLYICLYRSKVLIVGAVIFFTVSRGSLAREWKINRYLFFLPVLTDGLFNIFQIYSLVFPNNIFLSIFTSLTFYLALVALLVIQITWFYYLWLQLKSKKILDNEEITELVYMAGCLFYIVACQFVNALFGFTLSWYETGDNILIGYAIVEMLFILIATILPGRLLRNVAEVTLRCIQ